MKTSLFRKTTSLLVAPLTLALFGAQMLHAQEVPPKPDLFSIAAFDIGSSGYNQPMAASEGILEEFGIRSRLLPLSNHMARMRAAKTGQVNFFVDSTNVVFARRAWDEWADKEWGPQKVRLVWQTNRSSSFSIATRGDSDIHTIEDLKGKRIPFLLGSSSANAITEAYLNFEGLTWDDVEKVDVSGWAAAWEALAQGNLDASGGSTMATPFLQMEAGPYGVRWLELPYPPDHPGWAYFEEVYPTIYPAEISLAVGLEEGESISIFGFPFPDFLAFESVDNNVAYWMLKSITESYDAFKDIAPTMQDWTLERSLAIPLKLAPYHEGAVQYLKDVGKWTEELQAAQDRLLKEEAAYVDCWENAVSAHDESGGEEWPQFWKNYAETECSLKVRI